MAGSNIGVFSAATAEHLAQNPRVNSALTAAAAFTTLPLMVFFLLLQRQFIRGALSAAGSIR